jgi:pyruvate/2-oxoacid:ferredoxin oxidoreductase beta subunit
MESKSKITSSTKFDERRKVLIHQSLEEKETERGHLVIDVTETIHDKGIKNTLKDLEQKRKIIKENINKLEELQTKPEMTPELEELKENLKTLQLINHQENATEETKKKELTQLKDNQEDLKKIEKDLREIKQAIGDRLNLK